MAHRRKLNTTGRGIESLERRMLLAGDVTASIVAGSLEIWGDNVANDIIVDQFELGEGQVRLRSGPNITTINGVAGPVILNGFNGDVFAGMRQGPDWLHIRDMVIPGNLTIQTGLGIDEVTLFNVVVDGDTDIRTGVRPDVLNIDDSIFYGSTTIDTRFGADTVRIERSGADEAEGDVDLRSFFHGPVDIQLNRGDDMLQIGVDASTGNRAVFYSTVLFDGGENYDELRNSVGNWYDFTPVVLNFEFSDLETTEELLS